MAYSYYDRLSAVDTMFLEIEDHNVHMHVAAVALFENGPLANPDGTLAFDRIRTSIDGALEKSVRFKQKLTQVPITGDPVWIDDPRFKLDYHVRHTSLPRPGSVRTLKRLAGRILSQKLDRAKPLWEMWVVEGIEDDQFAIIAKAHHCMVDGISGFDILSRMLRFDQDETLDPVPRWYPRPEPSTRELMLGELRRRLSLPVSALERVPNWLRHPVEILDDVRETITAVGETLTAGLAPTMSTPLNAEIGPYRRFDWTETSIRRIGEIRARLG
ncbi:MAG: wax ester/triacylglycerol synthase family O-acyltransferase, partial [bacterium]|nr:wax ester/triacylglycerol synthase family O-acyltransferase [bacterium]